MFIRPLRNCYLGLATFFKEMNLYCNNVADQYCANIDASILCTQHCDNVASALPDDLFATFHNEEQAKVIAYYMFIRPLRNCYLGLATFFKEMNLYCNNVADQYCVNIDASILCTQHCDNVAST